MYRHFTLVIVDDGSTDGISDFLQKNYPDVVVLSGNGDLWWSGATNLGVDYAIDNNYDYVLILCCDSELEPDTLGNLVETSLANPGKIIGARIMLNRQGLIWALGVQIEWNAAFFLTLSHYNKNIEDINTLPDPLPTDCLTGNGTLIPIEVFKKIGSFNSAWCPQYHGDSEFTIRAKSKGFPSIVALNAVVYNNEFDSAPKFRIWDELFSKKSGHYWRPIVYIFLKYAPLRNIPNMFKHFSWFRKRLFKTIFN